MRSIAGIVFASLLAGCVYFGDDGESCANQACTALFASVGVELVDASGQRVTGMTTRTVSVETGAVLHQSRPEDGGEFGYVVVDDTLNIALLGDGDRHGVRFFADGAAGSAIGDFVIEAGACVCHVAKLSGPDTIVVE